MNTRKIVIFIFIIGLVTSQAFVLYQNHNIKGRINKEYEQAVIKIKDLQTRKEKMEAAHTIEGYSLPEFLRKAITQFDEKFPATENNSDYLLFFLFTPQSCGSCVSSEIHTWNNFINKYPSHKIQVIGITEKKYSLFLAQQKKKAGIVFPVFAVDHLHKEMEDFGIHFSPCVLLYSQASKKIIYTFFPDPIEKSEEHFLAKIQRLLEPL